jgi:uncharacterized protein YbbK (DUF523 family)
MGRRRVIMVSACLLGFPTRYDGKSKPFDHVIKLSERYILVPFCPEQLGGLPTPRPRSEIRGERVVNDLGEDVTENFLRGAEASLRIAKIAKPDAIILKSKSPSCGLRRVHDGTFSGKLIEGMGITARALRDAGYKLLTEEDLKDIEELYRG